MKPKIVLILFFTWGFFIYSCGNDQQVPSSEIEIEATGNHKYGDVNYEFPKLNEIPKTQASNWAVYEDFDKEVRTINGKSVDILKNKSERLVIHIDSLSKNVPDTLSNQSVLSRLLVVKTRVYLLNQELNKSRPDSIRLQNNITELNRSYSNLIIQINEKFEKDAIDLQRIDDEKKELEKQKRFLDSVYQSELNDQMN